jgi:hypothetical protein
MEALIIGEVVTNDQNSVAMLPVRLAFLGDLCLFGQDPLERLGLPFVKIDLLIIGHLQYVALVLHDFLPRGIQTNARAHYYDPREAPPIMVQNHRD